MVFVVDKKSGMILNRCDAWIPDSDLNMIAWAKDNEYKVLGTEITFNGDMVVWVGK